MTAACVSVIFHLRRSSRPVSSPPPPAAALGAAFFCGLGGAAPGGSAGLEVDGPAVGGPSRFGRSISNV